MICPGGVNGAAARILLFPSFRWSLSPADKVIYRETWSIAKRGHITQKILAE